MLRIMDTGIETIVFDLDDTLLVEEDSAHAAFLATCEHAAAACGVDAQLLCDAVRSASRTLWRGSPARAYCLRVGISSWEGLWAEFTGEDENLQQLRQWSGTYRELSWRHALSPCGVEDVGLARELGGKYIAERRSRHIVFDDTRQRWSGSVNRIGWGFSRTAALIFSAGSCRPPGWATSSMRSLCREKWTSASLMSGCSSACSLGCTPAREPQRWWATASGRTSSQPTL